MKYGVNGGHRILSLRPNWAGGSHALNRPGHVASLPGPGAGPQPGAKGGRREEEEEEKERKTERNKERKKEINKEEMRK